MANLFAQNSANWDSANMWNTVANGSGSYVTPGASDVCMANGKTVTVNISPTVSQVRNDTTGSATTGGKFNLSNGVTLTASVYGANGSYGCVDCDLSAPDSATLVGNVTLVDATNIYGARLTGTGTLNIVGNLTVLAANGNAKIVLAITSTGTVNVTGNCVGQAGGTSGGSYAIYCTTAAAIHFTGNTTGGSASSSTNDAIRITGASVLTLTGYLTSSGALNYGAISTGTASVSITGSCLYNGYSQTSTGSVEITGPVSGGTGVVISGDGIVKINGSITAGAAPSLTSSSPGAFVQLTGPFIAGSTGVSPIYCQRWMWWEDQRIATYYQVRSFDGEYTPISLYTADSVGGNPSTADVRSGTTFGPAGELTGSLAVPPAASVSYGVPVDNTTGTAAITASDISAAVWDTLVADLDTVNSIGARLAQAATVPSTGAQIAALGV